MQAPLPENRSSKKCFYRPQISESRGRFLWSKDLLACLLARFQRRFLQVEAVEREHQDRRPSFNTNHDRFTVAETAIDARLGLGYFENRLRVAVRVDAAQVRQQR